MRRWGGQSWEPRSGAGAASMQRGGQGRGRGSERWRHPGAVEGLRVGGACGVVTGVRDGILGP